MSTGTSCPDTIDPAVEKRLIGIVYNESSGLRAMTDEAKAQMKLARAFMAGVALKNPKVATPYHPGTEELKYPPAKYAYEGAKAAATSAAEQCKSNTERHFFIWTSKDGLFPDPRTGGATWPYDYKDRITARFGPFSNPKKGGDVPVGTNIYIFGYTGVP